MTDRNMARAWLAVFVIACLLMPEPAHAQSFMSGVVNFIQGNVIVSLGTLAIIGAGIVLLAMRMSLMALACVSVGIWIMFNADTLLGYVRG